jgi:hypothetical protein
MPSKQKKSSAEGSRARILNFLLDNVGRVLDNDELREASGNVSEWGRRLRELRDEYGYQILSHKDRRDLKPGQYLLQTDKRLPVLPRGISKETRAWVLERNGYTCQMCGVAAGDPDQFHPGLKIRLTMGHIIDQSKGGPDTPENLRAVCTNCNEGLQNSAPPKPRRIELLKQVRRATIDDQMHLLAWLEKRFEKIRPEKK